MNLGVEGVRFRDLVPLLEKADTVVIEGEVLKNRFGTIEELNKKGVEGRKEYFEEVVEIKKGKVNVYTKGKLKDLLEEEMDKGGLDYKKLEKDGIKKIHM